MRSTKYLALALFALMACDDPAEDKKSTRSDGGSKTSNDAGRGGSSGRDGGSADVDEAGEETGATGMMGEPNQPEDTTGQSDAGGSFPTDVEPPLDDAGVLQGAGSCCAARDTPGCGNADLMVCVCEKDPTCCTTAWGKQCVFIVEQKYCQPNVRECVCGSGDGQWAQTKCCESSWTSTCDTVAKTKCDAVPGCL